MRKLYKPDYDKLTSAEKQRLFNDIAAKYEGFVFKRLETFTRFGQSTETGVFVYQEREFVFVPGGTVTLGWDAFAVGMDGLTRNDLQTTLSEYGVTDLDAFLRSVMSPVREVTIGPMLAERQTSEIGWLAASLDEPEIKADQDIRQALERFETDDIPCLIYHESFRLRRTASGGVELHLYRPVSYADFKSGVAQDGFSLPTENEWEYLCGGGSRTLFRWGDSFDFDMKLKHFEAGLPEEQPYDLQLPNRFGLEIAYDPYRYEVIDDEPYLKGGDGGCYICGGSGMSLGYLPVATYFRDLGLEDDPIGYLDDVGGNYTCYRRIIRL